MNCVLAIHSIFLNENIIASSSKSSTIILLYNWQGAQSLYLIFFHCIFLFNKGFKIVTQIIYKK